MLKRILGLIALIMVQLDAVSAEHVEAGKKYSMEVEGLAHPIIYSVPANYSKELKWPVLIYYHGTNGKPVLSLLNHYTKGKDFVLIGMTYMKQGRFQYSEENLKQEISKCHAVIKKVSERCNLDEKQLYVGGFSKGGWVTAMFIDHDHSFKGGFVLGAGVYDRQLYKAKKFTNRTPVYIGVGREDGNAVMSKIAERHFKDLGAEVTLDLWDGVGHNWPIGKHQSKAFSQWLEMILLDADVERKSKLLQVWFDKELEKIAVQNPTAKTYVELEKLSNMPAVSYLGTSAYKKLQSVFEKLREHQVIKAEWEAQKKYNKVLTYEMRDRQLKTLRAASKAYKQVAEEFPNTIYGKRSSIDHKRTQYVIQYTEERLKQKKDQGK